MAGKGKPFAGKDDPRRNNGGVPKEVRELRALLVGDRREVHAALLAQIREGNVPCIIYAHTQLVGKPKERLEIDDVTERDSGRPVEELLAIGLGALLAKGKK